MSTTTTVADDVSVNGNLLSVTGHKMSKGAILSNPIHPKIAIPFSVKCAVLDGNKDDIYRRTPDVDDLMRKLKTLVTEATTLPFSICNVFDVMSNPTAEINPVEYTFSGTVEFIILEEMGVRG